MNLSHAFDGNTLAISNLDAARDWRLGMLRAVARLAAPEFVVPERLGAFSAFPLDGMNIHLRGNNSHRVGHGFKTSGCPIIEVTKLSETNGQSETIGMFDEPEQDVKTIRAFISCECGQVNLAPAYAEFDADDFIPLLFASQTNEES